MQSKGKDGSAVPTKMLLLTEIELKMLTMYHECDCQWMSVQLSVFCVPCKTA